MLSLLRHRCRRLSWVAFFAIFGLVFAPTISHAVALATTGGAWTDICSADTPAAGAADAGGSHLPVTGDHFQHCPLCGLGASPLLPPTLATLAVPSGLRAGPPPLFGQSPRPLFSWATAQPRAPPLLA